jgi:quercetin dioxygenase-like cupin family protein
VTVQVTEGSGTFQGVGDEAVLGVGEGAVYAPNEMHAIIAGEVPLRFLALITPRPGG